jgi:hypothetical protein
VGLIFSRTASSRTQSGKDWDWGKKGDFEGLGGRAGALEISNRVTRKLQDENRMSTKDLFDKIMSEDAADQLKLGVQIGNWC